jgi:ABC-2 type transport system permease protein
MISFPLFKAGFKLNWLLFLIFLAVLIMYMTVMVSMYDPENVEAMNVYLETLPEVMIDAMGFSTAATDLTSFIGLYYYGFIVLLFPMIFSIILANRLVAALVDRGSMAYLLSTPNTRIKIVTTQALFMIACIIIMLLINTVIGILFSESMFPSELDVITFMKLNLATIMLTLAVSSICFFFSCLFNETRYSLAFGAGIPLLFFVINMLRSIGENSDWLKYITIYTLFDAGLIINGEQSVILISMAFGAVTLVLYSSGIILFSRRNLFV